MPPINPADASYLLQLHVMRDMDNVYVMQRYFERLVQNAQGGMSLDQVYSDIQGGKLGQEMVWTRQYIQGMQNYLAQAQAAIAEGGTTALNFLRSASSQTAAIGEQALAYVESHPAETATLAGATGQAGIQMAQAGGTATAGTGTAAAGTAAEGSTVAAGAAAEGSTVAAGAAAEGSTVAAGALAEGSTVAAGAVAEGSTIAGAGAVAETAVAAGTVAETAAVATTAVAATEAGAGATLAAGAAGGSWLGPVGIAVGLTIAAAILTVTYVATHKDNPTSVPVVASTHPSSSTFSSSKSSSSDTDSSSTDTDSSSSTSDSSSSDTDSSSTFGGGGGSSSSSSSAAIGIEGRYVITEDKSRFSPGSSEPGDQYGCAERRVPDTITVTIPRAGGITLNYKDDPNSAPFDHDGNFDGTTFEVDYPDLSGINIEGRFEQFGSEVDIADGKLFSGDCTFYFSGKRQ